MDKANIPTTNTQLFTQLLDELGANILGIDVIMEQGIDVDYRDQRCIFLEVNSRPYLKMHDYPRWGTKENLDPYFEQLETLEVAHSDTY